jgi:hypothetical protein
MTRALVVLAAAALILSACGKRGELERPGPMFDVPAKTAPAR